MDTIDEVKRPDRYLRFLEWRSFQLDYFGRVRFLIKKINAGIAAMRICTPVDRVMISL